MDNIEPQDKNFDHEEVLNNINKLKIKLKNIFKHKNNDQGTDIDASINALSHQMSYFWRVVYCFYPLKKTYQNIKTNPYDYNNDVLINNEMRMIDLASKKSFLVLTAFSFEEILDVIRKNHNIPIKKNKKYESVTEKFLSVIDYFEIEREEYENLLKIFYFIRNTLHSGTFITRNFGPCKYKGKTFDFKTGQEYLECTTWNYFTFFASEIIDIFVKIYKSKKFKYA